MLVLISRTGVFTTKYKLVLTTFCFSEIFFAIYILLLSQTSQNLSFGMYQDYYVARITSVFHS